MSEFGPIPFVAGSVIGERSWTAVNGLLISPQMGVNWGPGTLEHECKANRENDWTLAEVEQAVNTYLPEDGEVTYIDIWNESIDDGFRFRSQRMFKLEFYVPQGSRLTMDMVHRIKYTPERGTICRVRTSLEWFMQDWGKVEPRGHSIADCSCGFYAYLQGHNEYHKPGDRVTGIIEGFGEVVFGTKGFRSTRAKVIALWAAERKVRDELAANYPVPIFSNLEQMRRSYPSTRVEEFS